MFRPMILDNQQLPEERCIEILKNQKRGVLAMQGDDGYPYAVPLNHFYNEEDGKIYFHSSAYGHKVDAIKGDPKVCFTVYEGIGLDGEIPWADNFQSVVIFGKVEVIEDRETVYDIARKLSYRFVDDDGYIEEQIEKDGPITFMFAICPEHMTGKQVREA